MRNNLDLSNTNNKDNFVKTLLSKNEVKRDRHDKYKHFSPESGQLMVNTEKGDTDTITRCEMNQVKVITSQPGDKKSKTLFTFGLGGCLSFFIVTQTKKGERKVVMSHFPPTHFSIQNNILSQYISQIPNDIDVCEFFAITPADNYILRGNIWEPVPEYNDVINTLYSTLKLQISKSIVHIKTYSNLQSIAAVDQGVVVVTLPGNSNEPIVYQIGEKNYGTIGSKTIIENLKSTL